ncbi:hypothetical protein JT359_04200 [Candidatus Poribacteria bacterium]|nr:hypothetical protein [Candidatus Poribacteria bacterium]
MDELFRSAPYLIVLLICIIILMISIAKRALRLAILFVIIFTIIFGIGIINDTNLFDWLKQYFSDNI